MLLILVNLQFCSTKLPSNDIQYKDIQLKVANFIKDCKAGDINGTSGNDVNYTAEITVYEVRGSNSFSQIDSKSIAAPSGADKSTFTTTIRVADNKSTRIKVVIDATECSKCQASCNSYTVNENGSAYSINGKPFWIYDNSFSPGSISSSLTVSPRFNPRNPSSPTCTECKIKL